MSECNGKECPKEIRDVLLDIMYNSFLFIRARPDNKDFVYNISDHVHNIPDIIKNFDSKKLQYYIESERSFLISVLGKDNIPKPLSELWNTLECKLKERSGSGSSN